MKKMIMVVMMLAVMMTGCSNNVKDVEKFEYTVVENLLTIKHELSTAIRNSDGTVTKYTKVYVYKDGEKVIIDETEETYEYLDYVGMFSGEDA